MLRKFRNQTIFIFNIETTMFYCTILYGSIDLRHPPDVYSRLEIVMDRIGDNDSP